MHCARSYQNHNISICLCLYHKALKKSFYEWIQVSLMNAIVIANPYQFDQSFFQKLLIVACWSLLLMFYTNNMNDKNGWLLSFCGLLFIAIIDLLTKRQLRSVVSFKSFFPEWCDHYWWQEVIQKSCHHSLHIANSSAIFSLITTIMMITITWVNGFICSMNL